MPGRVAKLPLILACLALAPAAAMAADNAKPNSLPSALSKPMRTGQTLEGYLTQVMAPFRSMTRQGGPLTAASVEAQRAAVLEQHRAGLISRLLPMDADGDGKVSQDEIRASLSRQVPAAGGNEQIARMLDRQVTEMMQADTDKDGFVTLQEIRDLAEKHASRGGRENPAEYLELVPAGAGLTARDLLARSLKAFSDADADGDGTLSKEEAMPFAVAVVARPDTQPPPPMPRPYQVGSLVLQGPGETVRSYAGFSASASGDRAESEPQAFTVAWTGGASQDRPAITLKEGRWFEIVSTDCAGLASQGRCTVQVRMSARANGVYKDGLTVAMGKASASIEIAGKASGWPEANLVWEPSAKERAKAGPVLVTSKEGVTFEFEARNAGPGPAVGTEIPVGDMTGGPKRSGWSVLPDSTCLTQVTPPGGRCVVRVLAQPTMDGLASGTVRLPGGQRHDESKGLYVQVAAKGIAGKLPKGVLGIGDACPAAGERGEVAVSSTGGFHANDGYFEGGSFGRDTGSFTLATAECDAWKAGPDGTLSCNNPGSGWHSSTLRRYKSTGVEGPWTPTELKERYISATLSCRDGRLANVRWTW